MPTPDLTTPESGFVSTDPEVRKKIAEMSAAAAGGATPTSTPATPTSPGYATPPPPFDPASQRGARENPLYIGPTNFGNIQQKYTPYQIEQATSRNATGDIFWKQGVDINTVPKAAPAVPFQAPQSPAAPTTEDLSRGGTVSASGGITTPTTGNEFAQAQSAAAKQYLTGITGALDGLAARQQDMLTAQKTQAEQNVKSLTDRVRGFFDSTATQDALKRDRELFKVKENIDTLNTIRGKIADASSALDQGILYEESRPVRMQLLTGRSAELKRQGIAGIGALQAAAEVVKGNIDLARAYADDTIAALKTDTATQINAIDTLLGMEQNNLIRLSKDEKDTIDYRRTLLEGESSKLDKQKDDLMDLAIKYPSAFSNGSVTFADSLQTAIGKMQPYLSQIDAEKLRFEKQKTELEIAKTKKELALADKALRQGGGGGGGSRGTAPSGVSTSDVNSILAYKELGYPEDEIMNLFASNKKASDYIHSLFRGVPKDTTPTQDLQNLAAQKTLDAVNSGEMTYNPITQKLEPTAQPSSGGKAWYKPWTWFK